ncbi:MAG: hypothetical protein JW740_02790 [Candidatus Zambryskibacteria bacterium]|nr:hypothetical protein [Candidatus Zambryskibacteria bacterium]
MYVHVFGDWYVDITGEQRDATVRIREQLLSLYPLNVYMPLEVDTITIRETKYIDSYEIFYFHPGDTIPIKLNFTGDVFVSADPLGSKSDNLKLIQKRASKLVGLRDRLSPERVIPDSMFLGRIGIIKLNHVKKEGKIW